MRRIPTQVSTLNKPPTLTPEATAGCSTLRGGVDPGPARSLQARLQRPQRTGPRRSMSLTGPRRSMSRTGPRRFTQRPHAWHAVTRADQRVQPLDAIAPLWVPRQRSRLQVGTPRPGPAQSRELARDLETEWGHLGLASRLSRPTEAGIPRRLALLSLESGIPTSVGTPRPGPAPDTPSAVNPRASCALSTNGCR